MKSFSTLFAFIFCVMLTVVACRQPTPLDPQTPLTSTTGQQTQAVAEQGKYIAEKALEESIALAKQNPDVLTSQLSQ